MAVVTRRLLLVANQLDSFFNHRLPAARAAKAAGYDVHVALAEADAARERDTDDFVFHALSLPRGIGSPIAELKAIRGLSHLIGQLRPSLIHAFTLKPDLYAALAARSHKVPLAASITGMGSFFLGTRAHHRLLQRGLTLALRYGLVHSPMKAIVQNHDDRDFVRDTLHVASEDIVLIPGSGVDLDLFRPATDHPQRQNSKKLRVVLAARMLRDKGVIEFAEAAKILRNRVPSVEFILAGTTDLANRSAIQPAQIEAWVKEERVTWCGQVDEMAKLYSEADIACLPSYREGLPKSLIEAASSGLPIVTTDVPGCREVVRDGETGFLVPAKDYTALANALARLIDSPDLRHQMGSNARKLAETRFGQNEISDQIIAVYEELCRPHKDNGQTTATYDEPI